MVKAIESFPFLLLRRGMVLQLFLHRAHDGRTLALSGDRESIVPLSRVEVEIGHVVIAQKELVEGALGSGGSFLG